VQDVGIADWSTPVQSTPVRVPFFMPIQEQLMSAPTQDAAASPPTRQQARASARHRSKLSQARLAGYLAAAGCCGLATTADAEVISIDINNPDISGPNANTVNFKTVDPWPVPGSKLQIYNLGNVKGFKGATNLQFSFTAGDPAWGRLRKFELDASLDSSASWTTSASTAAFYASFYGQPVLQADWGSDSFAGFRFGSGSDWNYGYLEVTWDSANKTFNILSGAYESQLNTPILAGALAPVPEPGAATMAFGALASLCLGGRALKRWKKQRRSEPQGDAGEPAHDLPQTAA
jgi:hypothetical protein